MINKSITSRLRRGFVEAFALRAVGIGLLFFMHMILGRALGTQGYGTFSYALALAGLLAIVVPLGWPTALMRFITQYVEQQSWGLLRGVVRRAYQVTLLSAVLASLTLWGLSYWERLSVELGSSLRFAALLLPLLSFVGLRRKALQGLQKVKASMIPEDLFLPLIVLIGLYLFSATTATGALLIYTVSAFLAFLLGSVLLWRSMPSQSRFTKPEFETRAWMAVAIPMVFGGLSQVLMNRTDVLMIGAMLNVETVGLYSAANRIAALNTVSLVAVGTIASPLLAAAFYGNRRQQAKEIMRRAMLWSALGALPLFVATIFLPQTLLGLFGQGFTRASLLLQVLAFGQFFNAATGPVGFILLMMDRERAFAWTMATVAVVNVVGNFFAIPAFGAVGAAMVTAASVVVLNCWQYLLSRSVL